MTSAPDGRRVPRVVVTVLAYRSPATIEHAVRSALEQDTDAVVDVLVREQGGDPLEAELVRRLQPVRPDRALTVTEGPNLGFAGGHEALLATDAARAADVVVLLNADAALDPSYLRHVLAAFDGDPTLGAVQAKVLRPGGGVIDAAGIVVHRNRRAEARFQGEPDDGRADEPGEVFGVDGAVAAYRRQALDDTAVDGSILPAELGSYHEDVDLAWRLRWRGWTARYEPGAVAWHDRAGREDPGLGRLARVRRRGALDARARRQAFANARLVTVRVEPCARLLRDAVPVLGREVGGWLLLLLARPPDVPACAWRIVRGLPAAWRARRRILGRRRPGADPYRWVGVNR